MIPITYILTHSISGYLFVLPVLLLYFLYGKKSGKKQTIGYIITVFLFCYYIIGVYTTTGITAFGTFAPRYPSYRRMLRVVCVGCLLSLCIEISQMFGMGITALNDILTNTAGACLGFCLYRLFARLFPKWYTKFQSVSVHGFAESLCFIIYPFLVMIGVQPYLLSLLYLV